MTSRIMKNSSVLTMSLLCLAIVLSSTISHFIRGAQAQNTSASKASPKVPFDVSAARLERNRRIASSNRFGPRVIENNTTKEAAAGAAQKQRVEINNPRTLAAAGSKLRLVQAGSNLELRDDKNTLLTSRPVSTVDAIAIDGIDNVENVLTIDFTQGVFNVGSINFVGGALPGSPGNSLVIRGGSFDVVTCTYSSPHDGSVQLGTNGTVVSYTNLTPMTINVTIADLVLVLPNGTVGGRLQDDGTPGNNTVQLVSTNASFEDTTFTVPTNSLSVDTGNGTTTISSIAGFSGDFNAALNINGKLATDVVSLNALALGNAGANPGSLSVTAKTIDINGAVNTTAGNVGQVGLTAGQTITVVAGITTSGGGITLSANQGAPTAGTFDGIDVTGATITSATGPILLQGKGGNTGSNNYGILVDAGAVISSTGTGGTASTITLTGSSGAGTNANLGILLSDANTLITSKDGAINLTGTGGAGTGNLNDGFVAQAAARVSSTGTAQILINGNGGGSGGASDTNDGVFIFQGSGGTPSTVTSKDGAILITGTAGPGANAIAIDLGNGGGTVSSTGTAPITLSGDRMNIDTTNGIVNGGTNLVTLRQGSTTTRNISVGAGAVANTLDLSDAELGRVTAGVLRIGRTDNAGNITFDGSVTTHAGYNTMDLRSGGSVLQTAGALNVANLDTITIAGVASVGTPLAVHVSNLDYNNTGGSVSFSNTGALAIANVGGVGNAFNNGTTTGLRATSPITFTVNTSSAGTLTATATESATPSVDNVTVNSGVTVQSTGGDVVFLAGDDVVINSTAVVQAPAGNIDFRTGFSDADNEGIMTLNGTVAAAAGTGTVALNVNSSNSVLAPGTSIVSEGAAGSVTGAGLLLLNFVPGVPGPFSLDASATNLVGTIAATTEAGINYRNNGALTVGTVNSPNEGVTSFGIFSTNHDVTLANASTLTLSQATNAGTATVRFTSGGGISQSAAGKITANDFGVVASGDADLSIASPTNHVTGTFAAANSASGAILKFKSDSGFMIGTLAAAGTFAGASGVTTNNGDINIDAGGDVTLNVVNAGTANVTLSSSGMNGLRSASPNDGTADVVGNQISLTVTGPSSGNAGQIGFFTTSAQFFEVNGNILNASTNNSRLWIRDVGSGPTAGIAVGSVNAGTNTAFLQVASGDLKSQTVDGNADVVAAAVNLRANNGGNVGIFGGTPLEINALNLNAAVLVAAGTINILDTAATMNVVLAQTVSGNIALKGNNINIAGPVSAGSAVVLTSATGTFTGGGGTVTATDVTFTDTSSTGHTWAITSASVTDDAGPAVPYSTTTNLTVNGGSGSDTFNVKPSSSTTFNINGGDPTPPATPGDALNVDTSGTTNPRVFATITPTGYQGSFQFDDRQPVNFSQIETGPQIVARSVWSSVNAAATVDEDSLATAAFDDFDFGLASGQTGTVTARYNVTAIRGISAFCPATQSTVRIRFRDSDGAGTAEQVLVTIHQTNILAGGNTTIFTFDSNAAGFPADSAFHTAVLTPAIDFDFARNIYWIEVQVSRSDSAAFANASKMDIWESVGTPCP